MKYSMGAVAALVLLAATGCQTMTGRTLGQNVDDTTIQAEVKAKLAAERLGNLTRVNVDTVNGVVYLMGVVPTPQDRVTAVRTARSVRGVRNVVDNLTVQSATAPPPAVVAAPAASPSTMAAGPRHTVVGNVTSVDHATGMLTVSTTEGNLALRFPPASVRDVRTGDRIRVDVGFEPIR